MQIISPRIPKGQRQYTQENVRRKRNLLFMSAQQKNKKLFLTGATPRQGPKPQKCRIEQARSRQMVHHTKNQSSSTLEPGEINLERTSFLNTVYSTDFRFNTQQDQIYSQHQPIFTSSLGQRAVCENISPDDSDDMDCVPETVSDAAINEEFASISDN